MSPAVGRATSKRLIPKQHPQRRRIRFAAEVYADIGVICSITIPCDYRFFRVEPAGDKPPPYSAHY